jgi:hypothetical protein
MELKVSLMLITDIMIVIYFFMSLSNKKNSLSASGAQKRRRFEFTAAWGSAPHPDKAWKGG